MLLVSKRKPAHILPFSLSLIFQFIFNYVCMCLGAVYVHMSAVPREAQGLEAPGARVTGSVNLSAQWLIIKLRSVQEHTFSLPLSHLCSPLSIHSNCTN